MLKNKSMSLSNQQKNHIVKLINCKMKPLKLKYKQMQYIDNLNSLTKKNKLERSKYSQSIHTSIRKSDNRYSLNKLLDDELTNQFQEKLLREGVLEPSIIKQQLQKNVVLKKIKIKIEQKKKLFKEKAKIDLWNKGFKDLQNVQRYSMDYLINVLNQYSQNQMKSNTKKVSQTQKQGTEFEARNIFLTCQQQEKNNIQENKQNQTNKRFQSQSFGGDNSLKDYIRLFKQPKYLKNIPKNLNQKRQFQLNKQFSQKIDIQSYRRQPEGIDPREKKFKQLQKIIYQKGNEFKQKKQNAQSKCSVANAKIRIKQNHAKIVKIVKILHSKQQYDQDSSKRI